MRLISMTEFVLEQVNQAEIDKEIMSYDLVKIFENYANFLNQPLKLEMFVPCDEDGNVLKEPVQMMNGDCLINEQYQQAKEKVLFENYTARKIENYYLVLDSDGANVWASWNKSKTIESLINEKNKCNTNT